MVCGGKPKGTNLLIFFYTSLPSIKVILHGMIRNDDF